MTDTPNAPTPTTPATAEQLREDAEWYREYADSLNKVWDSGEPERRHRRAAAALDAEAARMEAVTPTTDALDAAVEEAVEVVESLFRYDGRPEQRAVRDLVAAVEARAVARREAGEMQHPDTERFRVLTLHLLRHMTIADIDVFEEAVAEAGGEEPTDDHLVSAARVAVDALRLREDSPSSERLTEWGA